MSRVGRYFLFVVASLWLVKEIILPLSAAAIYSFRFMDLTLECDSAMEADWYERRSGVVKEEAAVVQLLACHDYDKARKVMLISGLPESYLAWLGLKALELDQRSPEEFVSQHRFTER